MVVNDAHFLLVFRVAYLLDIDTRCTLKYLHPSQLLRCSRFKQASGHTCTTARFPEAMLQSLALQIAQDLEFPTSCLQDLP